MEYSKSIEITKSDARIISEKIGSWWKEIAKESGTAASPGKLYAVGNYLVELVKNSLADGPPRLAETTTRRREAGKSDGKISVFFDNEKIKIVVEDFGSEDKSLNLNIGGDYGFKEVIEYADVLEIEADGKFFEKDKRNHMEETDESDLRVGSKITFIKYIVAPPAEEAEQQYRGRDFGQRM